MISTILLLIVALPISIAFTWYAKVLRLRAKLDAWIKTGRRLSYEDAACQTTDLDFESEFDGMASTPAAPIEYESLDAETELDVQNSDTNSESSRALLSKISLYNPKTQLTYLIPASNLPYHPESLQIPMSVLNRLCKCALELYEAEAAGRSRRRNTITTKKLNPSRMVFYVLEDGSCEVCQDGARVPEEWVQVPERVVEFLADEVVRWIDGESSLGETIMAKSRSSQGYHASSRRDSSRGRRR
ncbi:hypothetical protein TWF730_010264 [Orbilia blumenaviensis]|uniref:Uncharacterized protein n=1 Tax=Orbilia blumenaviensis TaxID=1796055 RepID=A0AAV9UNZ6_9PEZI